ncbi:unnamed protein product [Auanema sp. JU1783]|nr:unnamed protein product [Auanema sp. JU1783]
MEFLCYFFMAWTSVFLYHIAEYMYKRYKKAQEKNREDERVRDQQMIEFKKQLVTHVLKELTPQQVHAGEPNQKKNKPKGSRKIKKRFF